MSLRKCRYDRVKRYKKRYIRKWSWYRGNRERSAWRGEPRGPWVRVGVGRLVGFPRRVSARIQAHRHGTNSGTTGAATVLPEFESAESRSAPDAAARLSVWLMRFLGG